MSPPDSSEPQPALPIKLDESGLVPVIVQDRLTGEVRMLAFASPEAIRKTAETGKATFYSRSRRELWEKGQTSGNAVAVHRILVDCDADCLVYSGDPEGPSCHTGETTCFFRALENGAIAPDAAPQTVLVALEATLEARKQSTAKSSYTKSLYDRGAPAIGAKIREEAGELADAIASEADDRVVSEAADVLYHLIVGLRWRGIAFRRVLGVLAKRFGTSGHEEKASR